MDDVYEFSSGTPPRRVSEARRITKLVKEIKEMKDVIRILWGKIIGRTYSTSRLTWNQLRKAVLYPLNVDTGEQIRELRDGTQLSADFEKMLMNKMSAVEKKIDRMARQMEALRKENIKSQVDSAFETPQNDLPDFGDEVFKDTAQAYIFPEQATVDPQVCPPKKSFFTSPSIRFNPSVPPAVRKKTKALSRSSKQAFVEASDNKCAADFLDAEFDLGEIQPAAATAADQDVSSPVVSNAPQMDENFVPTKRLLIYSTSENIDNAKKLPISSAINTSKTSKSAIFTPSSPFSVPVDDNHAFASSSRVNKSLDLKPAASKTIVRQKKKSHSSSILPLSSTPSFLEKSNAETQNKPFNLEQTPSNAVINKKGEKSSYAMLNPSMNPSQEVKSSDEIPVKPYDLEDTTCDTVIKHKRKNPSSTMLVHSPSSSLGEVSNATAPHKSLELKDTPFNVPIKHKRKKISSALLDPLPSSTFNKLSTLARSEIIPKSLRLVDRESTIIIPYKRQNPSSTILNASPLVDSSDIETPPKSPDIPPSKVIKHKRRNPRSVLLNSCRTCAMVDKSRAEGPQKSFDSEESIYSDVIITLERKNSSSTTLSSSQDTPLKEKYNTENPQVSHDLKPAISNVIIKRETCTPESSIAADSPIVSKHFHPEVDLEERPSVSKYNINEAKYNIRHKRRNPSLFYPKSTLVKSSSESSPPLFSCEEMFNKILTSTPITKTSCNTEVVQSIPSNVVSNYEDNDPNQKFISLNNTPQKLSNAEFPSQERISQIIQMASTSMLQAPSTSAQPDENEQIKPPGVEMLGESSEVPSTRRSSSHQTNDPELEVDPSQAVDLKEKEDESQEGGDWLVVGGSTASSY